MHFDLICKMKNWVLGTLFLVSCHVYGQQRQDAASWLSLVLEQKLPQNLSLKVQSRFRFADNISHLKSYYIDLGLFYKVSENFKVSLDAVYAPYQLDNSNYKSLFQYYASISNTFQIAKKWSISNRVIGQYTSSNFIVDNGTIFYMRADLREKLTFGYDLNKKTNFYLADEIMAPISVSPFLIRRNRLYIGVNRKITKQFEVDLYFLLQNSFFKKVNTTDFIYGLTLGYKFKKWK